MTFEDSKLGFNNSLAWLYFKAISLSLEFTVAQNYFPLLKKAICFTVNSKLEEFLFLTLENNRLYNSFYD
jgi:hypothetical protein